VALEDLNAKHYRELQDKCSQIEQIQAQNMLDMDDLDNKYERKLKRQLKESA